MGKAKTTKSGGGFKIPFCGKQTGRTLIRSRDANELIAALNSLGNMRIVTTENDYHQVLYSDGNVVLALAKTASAPNVEGSVTVAEIDGSPSVANVTTIKFPNGTVTNPTTGVVEISATATITVEEVDGTPSVAATEIKFPNGSVTDSGGGVATVVPYITVEEVDGTPSVSAKKIVFPNASVTDSGSGTATVSFVSGGVSQYRVKSVQGDYCTCRTWDGTTEGSDVYVAKPYKLRNPGSEIIDGVTVNYTSYPTSVSRVADISGTTENQVIVPRYLSNDLIYVATSNYTGVSVSGTPLTLIDVNCDGRAWAKE